MEDWLGADPEGDKSEWNAGADWAEDACSGFMLRRQLQRREAESLHEWHGVVPPDTDEVCNSNGFVASPRDCVSKWSATGTLTGGCGQGFSAVGGGICG